MAIDTAAKRNSAMLGSGCMLLPDGAISGSADRGAMLDFYSGIGSQAPAPVTLSFFDVTVFFPEPWSRGWRAYPNRIA